MDEQKIDELIAKVLQDEVQLPDGLSERLERHIDQMTEANKEEAQQIPIRKRWISQLSVAASILLALGISISVYFLQAGSQPKDTFNDPQEAALVAEHALMLLSQNLNKGLNGVQQAHQEVTKVNQVLNKQLND